MEHSNFVFKSVFFAQQHLFLTGKAERKIAAFLFVLIIFSFIPSFERRPDSGYNHIRAAFAEEVADEDNGGYSDDVEDYPNIFVCNLINIDHCFGSAVYYIFFVPANYVLATGGYVFDIITAFSMSTKVLGADFVRVGWDMMRDLANIFFIFILLFISIATILQIEQYGAKKLLSTLIVVALLVNFSLFISRVIVDTGNIAALFFYNNIAVPDFNTNASAENGVKTSDASAKDSAGGGGYRVGPESLVDEKEMDFKMKSISAVFARAIQPQKILTIEGMSIKDKEYVSEHIGALIVYYIVSAAIMAVAGWIFFSVAFVFLGRIAVLWFLMALAPLAFAAMAFPQAAGWGKKWWSELFNKSFVIAVFMFFIWFIALFADPSNNIMKSFITKKSDLSFIEFFVVAILYFGTLIVLLFMAKKTALKMGNEVGGMAINLGKKLGGVAGMSAGFVGGKLGRGVVGLGASRIAKSEGVKNWAARSRVGATFAKGMRRMADSTYDFRNTRIGGQIGEGTEVKFGKGSKKTYEKTLIKKTEKKVSFAKDYLGKGKGGKERVKKYGERMETPKTPFSQEKTLWNFLRSRSSSEAGEQILKTGRDEEKDKAKEMDLLARPRQKENSMDEIRRDLRKLGAKQDNIEYLRRDIKSLKEKQDE